MSKRLLDLLSATLGLALLWPLFLLIALAIKLDSPGPVFFRQQRIGRYGVPFRLFKFRTMSVAAEVCGPQITVGEDVRITRVGRFLRHYKLDELPQLIDVVRGTMSLVGPRPEVPRYVSKYPPQRREQLLSVRPGITDFASLRYRNESELLAQAADPEREYVEVILPEKLRVAGNYIEHASMRSDLKLLGLTLRTVFWPVAPIRKMDRFMSNAGLWQRMDTWLSHPWRYRTVFAVLVDACLVLAAWHLTYLFRLGFERWQPGRPWYDDYVSLAVVGVYLSCMHIFAVRGTMWRYFGFDDLRRLALACLCAGPIAASGVLLAELVGVSRAVLVLHPLFALLAMVLSRMAVRVVWEHAHNRADGDDGVRRYVILVGANPVARRLLAGLHLRHGWHVLMLLDDNAELHGMRIAGVNVAGSIDRLRDPSLTLGATHVIIALDKAQEAQCEQAIQWAQESGLVVLMVPDADMLESAS
jgi:lipopolysaccharide/colanic/teichoic acid biosynthesis glycosyltransferase